MQPDRTMKKRELLLIYSRYRVLAISEQGRPGT